MGAELAVHLVIAVAVAFESGHTAGALSAAITVSLSPDRVRGTVRGIHYGAVPERDILLGAGRLLTLVNGYHSNGAKPSWYRCRKENRFQDYLFTITG